MIWGIARGGLGSPICNPPEWDAPLHDYATGGHWVNMLKINGILETAIFVDNQATSFDFYKRVLGFEPFGQGGFLVAPGQILLLVQRGTTLQPKHLPGGKVPACGASGSQHIAFSVSVEAFEMWRARLIEEGIADLSEVQWDLGGRSLFFRDPDGHLLELATPGVWEVY